MTNSRNRLSKLAQKDLGVVANHAGCALTGLAPAAIMIAWT